ncbi:CotH kinase family protein [Eubacteriales bacterium OttesenSCG-928-A19]|nr:CotH kinase family protein [Eubacteriales bacterium OttesenSCG-928-A19]
MAKSRHTNLVCGIVIAAMLGVTVLCMFASALGIETASAQMPYVESLFDTSRVHSLDIVVDEKDWQGILDNAMAKEYIPASLVIDGEAVRNVGIRTKGNSSLSSIAMADSDRYSFKIEFDHYEDGKTYKGLDKLALNNITQDNTYLKDYLCYVLMDEFDAYGPLCSFIWITVNGEDWGLYLAVEGIEESFAQRTFGSDYGLIYKPDSMDMGGGGGGRDRDGEGGGGFEMPEEIRTLMENEDVQALMQSGELMTLIEGGDTEALAEKLGEETAASVASLMGGMFGMSGGQEGEQAEGGGQRGGMGGFGGHNDVALVYTDDDPDSYANILENASLEDPGNADQKRLIETLRKLNAGEDIESVVNVEEVLRYFVVHNFVLNFDSYTGSMTHNYYLYEKDGQLSMIAWDYNLAFGSFGGMGGGGMGGGGSDATSLANYPIDTPTSGASLEDRPLLYQLLSNETYLERYHELFDEFIATVFESGRFEAMYDEVVALIAPYVEKDPTAFCTYEEFETATATLRTFIPLRAESIRGQLDGTIPATSEGQAADSTSLVDASGINLEDTGGMGRGFDRARGGEGGGGGGGFAPPGMDGGGTAPQDGAPPDTGDATTTQSDATQTDTAATTAAVPSARSGGPEMGQGMPAGEMPEGMSMGAFGDAGDAPMMPMDGGEGAPPAMGEAPGEAPTSANETSATGDAPSAPDAEATPATQNARGGMPGGGGGGFGAFPGRDTEAQQEAARAAQRQQYLYLGISAVVLVAGILFAWGFGRRR